MKLKLSLKNLCFCDPEPVAISVSTYLFISHHTISKPLIQ